MCRVQHHAPPGLLPVVRHADGDPWRDVHLRRVPACGNCALCNPVPIAQQGLFRQLPRAHHHGVGHASRQPRHQPAPGPDDHRYRPGDVGLQSCALDPVRRAVQVYLSARQKFPYRRQELLQQTHRSRLLDTDARKPGAYPDAQERPSLRNLVQRPQRRRDYRRMPHVGVGDQAADADVAGGGGAERLQLQRVPEQRHIRNPQPAHPGVVHDACQFQQLIYRHHRAQFNLYLHLPFSRILSREAPKKFPSLRERVRVRANT